MSIFTNIIGSLTKPKEVFVDKFGQHWEKDKNFSLCLTMHKINQNALGVWVRNTAHESWMSHTGLHIS